MRTLFDNPVSHTDDHESSRLAADKVTKTGRRATNSAVVLSLVVAFPGSTSGELAEATEAIDLTELRRRLTDLLHAGKVVRGPIRECRVRGSKMVTWEVAK